MRFRETAAASRLRLAVAAGFFGFALAACGGGGSGGNDNGENDIGGSPGGWNTTPAPGPEEPSSPAPGPGLPEPELPQPPAPEPGLVPQPEPSPEPSTPTVAIEGTAASGAALAGAAIDLKCAGTTRHGNADGAGRYRLDDVRADALPCLLRASYAQTVYVAPVASQGAGVITVNATPLTHLLASRMLGQPADLAFANAGASTFGRINPAAISAAQGQVHAQLGRLGYLDLPADWIGTSFQARAGDPYDGALDALGIALGNQGLTVPLAAGQLASAEPMLQLAPPSPPAQACAPRLIDGFAGADRRRWTTVGSGAQRADGIGIGGGPGFVRGALVDITFADGTQLAGAHTDADKGMVTLAVCEDTRDRLPALVRLRGEPQSTYYDPGLKRWASFSGGEFHAIVTRIEADVNLAVTPLTEAVYQRVLGLWNEAGGQHGAPAAWQEPGRIQVAHDQVLAAVNDQVPGMYRLERLDRLPWLLDESGDVEGSNALPRDQSGIHGVVLAAFARAAAQARPTDPAPMRTFGERFAADLADGRLDNPHAGLDSAVASYTVPPYEVGLLWDRMAAATVGIGRKVGVPALWSGKPFPLGLVVPMSWRSQTWSDQYIGLYSDGILRIAVLRKDDNAYCGNHCNPTRRVRIDATSEWWIYDVGRLDDLDPDSMTGTLLDGTPVRIPSISDAHPLEFSSQGIGPQVIPNADPLLRGLREIQSVVYGPGSAFRALLEPSALSLTHHFGIDHEGMVYRVVDLPVGTRNVIALPAAVRQLSSDGRLVYALLSNDEVYLLNPELLASQAGFFPSSPDYSLEEVHWYEHRFISAGHPKDIPLRVEWAWNICRIGGIYLQRCDGLIFIIDRPYFWQGTDVGGSSVRGPGDDYSVRVDTGLDAREWRAFKAPMRQDPIMQVPLRLLSRTDGSYVLQSDTWGVEPGPLGYLVEGGNIQQRQITQATVESWLGY